MEETRSVVGDSQISYSGTQACLRNCFSQFSIDALSHNPLLKMGNEIAYLMPTKCKIFLGKRASLLDPWETLFTDCPSRNSKWNDAHA